MIGSVHFLWNRREAHKLPCALQSLGCSHAEEALEVSAVPDCTLIHVKSEGVEMIMVPLTQVARLEGASNGTLDPGGGVLHFLYQH